MNACNGLPLAFDHLEQIAGRLAGRRLAVFLDYDGTLTPTTERPEMAHLPERTRATVRDLAERCTVAVISGRDREDVEKRVGLEGLIYAGNHGFDIAGPEGSPVQHRKGTGFGGILATAERNLREKLDGVDGILIEAKKSSIAVHYRLVAEDTVGLVRHTVERTMEVHPELRLTPGKKVLEIQPRLDWNKGKAVLWLLDTLDLNRPGIMPLYMGDDTTDEDAFRALKGKGMGILVGDTHRASEADYRVADPMEAERLLRFLAGQCKGNG